MGLQELGASSPLGLLILLAIFALLAFAVFSVVFEFLSFVWKSSYSFASGLFGRKQKNKHKKTHITNGKQKRNKRNNRGHGKNGRRRNRKRNYRKT